MDPRRRRRRLPAGLQGFRIVPSIFFPPSHKAIFTAEYELPAGTSIERTMEVVEAVDRFVSRELRAGAGGRSEGVTNWATFAGDGGPRFYLGQNPAPANPQFAFSLLNATSPGVISDELIPCIAAFCRERFPELDVKLNPLQLGPGVGAPVQVRLSGRAPTGCSTSSMPSRRSSGRFPAPPRSPTTGACAARSWWSRSISRGPGGPG